MKIPIELSRKKSAHSVYVYGALDVRLFPNKRLNVDLKNIEIWVSHGLKLFLPYFYDHHWFLSKPPYCSLFNEFRWWSRQYYIPVSSNILHQFHGSPHSKIPRSPSVTHQNPLSLSLYPSRLYDLLLQIRQCMPSYIPLARSSKFIALKITKLVHLSPHTRVHSRKESLVDDNTLRPISS